MNRTTGFILTMALTFLLGLSAGLGIGYTKHSNLKGQVEQANREAKNRLNELARERDIAQARINKLAKEQEGRDSEAKAEIERLSDELANRPVRVRIEPRQCGGSTTSGASASAQNSAGNKSSASGVLPKSNSRRL